MGALLRIQLATAQRGGEVRAMRWDEIDGDWWTIPAEKSKKGLAHRVPISDLAKTILAGVNVSAGRLFILALLLDTDMKYFFAGAATYADKRRVRAARKFSEHPNLVRSRR